jgi:asparagine synthase (glutamine-hydrolysing)
MARVPAWIAPGFARRIRLAERLIEAVSGTGERTAFGQMHQRLISRPSYNRSVEWYDRNSGPLGIEVRHPFLDRRLFEFVFALRPEHLFRLGERKHFMRQALAGILPDAVRLRHKTGLGSFVDFSLRKEASRVRSLLAAPLSADLGIIEGRAVRQAFEHYSAGEVGQEQRYLWYVITLELWLQRHFHTFDATPFEILASARQSA